MSETNCEKNIIGNCEKTGEAPVLPASIGRYYEDTVPDTTDLAEHGRLALSYFINTISTDLNYEMPYAGDFRYSRPPAMRAFLGSLSVCQAKCMEAMAFMRVMCGSTKDLELEAKMVEMMASMLGDDGLYWVYPEQSKMGWLCIPEPYTHIAGQGTMMRAMFTWYQYSGDPVWKQRIDKMVDGIDRLLVVHKDDYAYVPSQGFYDGEYLKTLYVKRGFRNYNEPETEKFGEEGGLFNNFRLVPGPLANWYRLTGNKQALKLSGELIRFALKSKFWSDWKGGEYPGVVGSDHAHWHGGFHGYVDMLRSILEYAVAINDVKLKEFVRDGYEWTRQQRLSRIGLVGDGQGCGCARLIGLAVKMTLENIGDYWEDIDLYIRNQGTEMQITHEDIPYLNEQAAIENENHLDGEEIQSALNWDSEEVQAAFKTVPIAVPYNKLIDMAVGTFPATPFKNYWALCCTGVGPMGLFYAWDGMLRYQKGTVFLNLLLNRASPWLDVYSYLPYEGKVILRIKAAGEAFIRIPLWVEKSQVDCRVGDKSARRNWHGSYLRFEHLKNNDIVTIEFPVPERVEKWQIPDYSEIEPAFQQIWPKWKGYDDYELRFKGNTVIEITPGLIKGSPCYKNRPEKYKHKESPMKQIIRFETPFIFKW